jgi:hypothetical protein
MPNVLKTELFDKLEQALENNLLLKYVDDCRGNRRVITLGFWVRQYVFYGEKS